ncbi:MAG: 3-oxoacyl-[acyl-carrier protein] reductase [Verrucomicrobiota bacterium]|jgi:3-oxoacyl-[acyl-carrier protein] reductase
MKFSEAQLLVTGGGRGIGRHLVDRAVAEARRVAIFEKDKAIIADLSVAHPAAKCYLCDVTDPRAVAGAVAALESDGFALDVLVNNAGFVHSAPLINLLEKNERVHSAEDWQQVLAANLSSVFYVTGPVVSHMLKSRTKGVVISMSSISARGNAGQSAYSAAKAGVNALTRTWAKELGGLGLRFVSIAPGFMDTPSTREALSDAHLTKLKGQIPLRRLGEVEHVYQTVRFIAENDYINGTVIEIDGGLVI